MTVRHHCGSVDEGLSLDATSGVTPPLLPTLVVALVLGAASLICREPAAPAPAPSTAISTTLAPRGIIDPVTTGTSAENFLPATLAFSSQFPLVVATLPQVAAQGPRRPAGPRLANLHRAPSAKGTSPTRTASPVESSRGDALPAEPFPHLAKREASGDPMPDRSLPDLALPDLALPFAPAVEAASQVRDFVGGQGAAARAQAVALSGAVVEFVEALR